MKLSSTGEPARTDRLDYINERWKQLLRLVEDTELRALKYLTLTNSGGAIAVLSFMGASESVRNLTGPKIALGFFIVGIILTGVLMAKGVHMMDRLLRNWRNDVKKYFSDEIGWKELIEADERRTKPDYTAYVLGYSAFACFILGSMIGLFRLLF